MLQRLRLGEAEAESSGPGPGRGCPASEDEDEEVFHRRVVADTETGAVEWNGVGTAAARRAIATAAEYSTGDDSSKAVVARTRATAAIKM